MTSIDGAAGWLYRRLRSLFSYKCFERRILLDLAGLRNGAGALSALALFIWQYETVGALAAVILVPCNGVLWALISADFIERALRMLAFGEVDNVNISARCELEGANVPTHREQEPEWRQRLRRAVWPDDPASGEYDPPIPTMRGRLRAIVTGAL